MASAGHLLLFLLAAAAGGEALGQSGNLENPINYDRLQSVGRSALEQYNSAPRRVGEWVSFCQTAKGHVANGLVYLTVLGKEAGAVAPVVYAARVHPDGVLDSLGYDVNYIPTSWVTCPK